MKHLERIQSVVAALRNRRKGLEYLRTGILESQVNEDGENHLALVHDENGRPWYHFAIDPCDARTIIDGIDLIIESVERQLTDIDSQLTNIDSQLAHITPKPPEQETTD